LQIVLGEVERDGHCNFTIKPTHIHGRGACFRVSQTNGLETIQILVHTGTVTKGFHISELCSFFGMMLLGPYWGSWLDSKNLGGLLSFLKLHGF
jgi:hypothetical protein